MSHPSTPHARWSLQRRLPLLLTALLAVLLCVALVVTYGAHVDAARDGAKLRLQRQAAEIASQLSDALRRQATEMERVARNPAVLGALAAARAGRSPEDSAAAPFAAARQLLQSLLERSTGAQARVSAELWDADGRRVAFAGADLRGGTSATRADADRGPDVLPSGFDAWRAADSLTVSPVRGDGGVSFWAVVPVTERGRRVGYVARRFLLRSGAEVEQRLRALTGAEVAAFYRNVDTGELVSFGGQVAAAPIQLDSTGGAVIVRRPGVGDFISASVPVAGAPVEVVLERPLDSALAAPAATLRRLALGGVLLLAIGAMATYALTRRATRPLVALTRAADAIARGDRDVRVEPAGAAEFVKLAASFNHMASEIAASRAELERQTAEAREAARELEHLNRELAVALRNLEEREAEFRALVDAIPQLAWMATADGSVYWFNERWYAYTGTSPEAPEHGDITALVPPDLQTSTRTRWRSFIARGAPFEIEFPIRRNDGRYRWFLTRVHPVRDCTGRVTRWFGTSTDVQTLRDALELAQAARVDAEAAREQAEQANRAKSEFLAVMSHELRTPLNAIGGYTELIALGLRGPVTEEQRRDLERIQASQQHLLGLISGVLDLSRIESGRVTYDLVPVPLHEFLSGLDALVAPQAAAKELALVYLPCDAGLTAMADREKLRQILLNLLSNAIRYTPAGGRIELSAARRPDETMVGISVRDTGVGISAEALERIFEPFVQLDRSLTRTREGVGLGLAISHDLALGMGGDILVESMPGVGSCFTLVLPAAVAPGAVRAPRLDDGFASSPRTSVS